jgi:hypothetical protein
MARNYSVSLKKLIKLAKRGDQSAQLLLAMTDLSRVLGALAPENITEDKKQQIASALISGADASVDIAKLKIRNAIEKLTIIEGWLNAERE